MLGHGRRETERSRGLRWFAAGAGLAVAGATVLAMGPASAEAGQTTATLTLTGAVDSNCGLSVGGTTVYVAPGGTVDFKAALAGIHVKVLGLDVPLDTSTVASFVETVTFDDDLTHHPYTVSGSDGFQLKNVTAARAFRWSTTSVTIRPIPVLRLLAPNGITIPLNANTVIPSSLPVGGSLSWTGKISTSKTDTCGVSAQLPGGTLTAGPLKVTVPAIALPSVTVPDLGGVLPGIPGLPGGKTTGSNPGQTAPSTGANYTPPGLTIPQLVVPSGNGDGPGTVDANGFGNALPNLGNGSAGGGSVDGTSTDVNGKPVAAGKSAPQSKSVELAANPSPSAQMPVLLAIVAIIALSLVTALYARLYLLRRTP